MTASLAERIVNRLGDPHRPAAHQPARLPRRRDAGRRGAGGEPVALPDPAGQRLRRGVRRAQHLRRGLHGVLLHHQRRQQQLPAGLVHRRLVEGRQLLLLRRQRPLLRRLQRLPGRPVHLPLQHHHLRPAPGGLQPVPLRPVQHPDPVVEHRAGAVPGGVLHAALGEVRRHLLLLQRYRQQHRHPLRAVPDRQGSGRRGRGDLGQRQHRAHQGLGVRPGLAEHLDQRVRSTRTARG